MTMGNDTTRLIIIRHGETIWNTQKRWQGWLNSPLTPHGKEQARGAAAIAMTYGHPVCAYISDTGRAMQTAKIIVAAYPPEPPIPIIATNCLRERYYGLHESLTAQEIDALYPGTRFTPGRDRREDYSPPYGESFREARKRLYPFVRRIVARHRGDCALLVTHSGMVRLFDSLAHGYANLDDIWQRHPPNGCVVVLDVTVDGKVTIIRNLESAVREL